MDDLTLRALVVGLGAMTGWIAHAIIYPTPPVRRRDRDRSSRAGRDERGAITWPMLQNLGMVVIIAVVIFTAVRSQQAANRVNSTQDRIRDLVACQSRWNEESSAVTKQRSKWADEDRAALNSLIRAIATPNAEKALNDYLATVAANDKLRRANPVPVNSCRR